MDKPICARAQRMTEWQAWSLARLGEATGRFSIVGSAGDPRPGARVLPFPEMFSPDKTAEILHMSRAALGRQMRAGRIAAYRPGKRRIYFTAEEINAYIERNTAPCQPVESSAPDRSEPTGSAASPDRRSIIDLV